MDRSDAPGLAGLRARREKLVEKAIDEMHCLISHARDLPGGDGMTSRSMSAATGRMNELLAHVVAIDCLIESIMYPAPPRNEDER